MRVKKKQDKAKVCAKLISPVVKPWFPVFQYCTQCCPWQACTSGITNMMARMSRMATL